jgi:predicted aspartyl protease
MARAAAVRAVIAVCAVVALAAPAFARDGAVEAGPQFAAPTTADGIGRVVAPVFVNGQGPYRFIVDTGANRSTLSPRLARALGIDVAGAPRQLVHGVTGAEPAPTVRLDELRAGRLARQNVEASVVANRIHANADGMLGADHVAGARLVIDFRRDRIELLSSSPTPHPSTFVLPAQMRFGRLPLVSVRIGGVLAKAVIDTGAERSLGNSMLRTMLLRERTRLISEGMTTVYGAVGPDAEAELVWAPRLTIGGVRIQRLPILFGDTHFFRLWSLENEPALLIGMDVLGQLDTLVIDYRRREVQFRLRTGRPGLDNRAKASRLD